MTILFSSIAVVILALYLKPIWSYFLSTKSVTIKHVKKDGTSVSSLVRLPKDDPVWDIVEKTKGTNHG